MRHIKKIFAAIFLLFIRNDLISQTIIGSIGNNGGSPNFMLSYTLGETFTNTLPNNTITFTNGFQQPDIIMGFIDGFTRTPKGYIIKNVSIK